MRWTWSAGSKPAVETGWTLPGSVVPTKLSSVVSERRGTVQAVVRKVPKRSDEKNSWKLRTGTPGCRNKVPRQFAPLHVMQHCSVVLVGWCDAKVMPRTPSPSVKNFPQPKWRTAAGRATNQSACARSRGQSRTRAGKTSLKGGKCQNKEKTLAGNSVKKASNERKLCIFASECLSAHPLWHLRTFAAGSVWVFSSQFFCCSHVQFIVSYFKMTVDIWCGYFLYNLKVLRNCLHSTSGAGSKSAPSSGTGWFYASFCLVVDHRRQTVGINLATKHRAIWTILHYSYAYWEDFTRFLPGLGICTQFTLKAETFFYIVIILPLVG